MTARLEPRDALITALILDVRGFTAFAHRATAREAMAFVDELFGVALPPAGGPRRPHPPAAGRRGPRPLRAPRAAARPRRPRAGGGGRRAAPPSSRELGDRCRIGIGVNSGLVLAGTIVAGATEELTVIGDPVNVAARVQQATRDLGEPVLVTEATRCLLERGGDRLRPCGTIAAKGKPRADRGLRAVRRGRRNGARTPRPYKGDRMPALVRTVSSRLRGRRAPADDGGRADASAQAPGAAAPAAAPVEIGAADPLLAYLESASGRSTSTRSSSTRPRCATCGRRRQAGRAARQPGRAHRRAQPRAAPVRAGVLHRRPPAARRACRRRRRPPLRVGQLVREQEAEARTRERFEQELEVARLIQQHFLPRRAPRPARLAGRGVLPAGPRGRRRLLRLHPAARRPGRLRRRRRDRQGRARRRWSWRPRAASCAPRPSAWSSPARCCERVNEHLCPRCRRGCSSPACTACSSRRSGRLRFANAGHDLPYVRTADGVVELRATRHAARADAGHGLRGEGGGPRTRASSVLLYSDGLVEAHDARPRDVRLPAAARRLVAAHRRGSELIDRVLERARRASPVRARSRRTTSRWSRSQRSAGGEPRSRRLQRPRARRVRAAERARQRAAWPSTASRARSPPLGLGAGPRRAAEDGRQRGHDERDGARQRATAPTGRSRSASVAARDRPARHDHRPGRRRRSPERRDARTSRPS